MSVKTLHGYRHLDCTDEVLTPSNQNNIILHENQLHCVVYYDHEMAKLPITQTTSTEKTIAKCK